MIDGVVYLTTAWSKAYALDARTGEQIWHFDPEVPGAKAIGVGNGSPWNHKIHSNGQGDTLFLSSIVALHPDTGEYVWHFQTTPAESWDYTATQHMILADLEIDDRQRQVIMQAPKRRLLLCSRSRKQRVYLW